MSKSKQPNHFPLSPKIICSPKSSLPTFTPQRSADHQLLQTENEIFLKYQSEDDSILGESMIRIRGRKSKPSLHVSQIEALKKENGVMAMKNQEMKVKIEEITLRLKQREVDHKNNLTTINELNQALRASQKRKSILELELSKLYNQLEANRTEVESYEKQINRLLSLHTSKDSELIDLMHRNSDQIKEIKAKHKAMIDEYEQKQDETKKLLKKLNSINLQKQQKLIEEIEVFRANNDKISAQLRQKDQMVRTLQGQQEILQAYIKNNTDKYETDLVSMKNQSDRVIRQVREQNERRLEEVTTNFQRQILAKNQNISKLRQKLDTVKQDFQAERDEKERVIRQINEEFQSKQDEYRSMITEKDRQIEKMVSVERRMRELFEREEILNGELFSKNQLLEASLKQLQDATAVLESKLAQIGKQKSSMASENQSTRQQLLESKQSIISLQKKLSKLQKHSTETQQNYSQLLQSSSQLQPQLNYCKKALQLLEAQYSQLNQAHSHLKTSNTQLQSTFIQTQTHNQFLKDKCIKLQLFIDNFKMSSEKNREKMERKWVELREMYENQLEELEGKVVESEKRYAGLKLRMEKTERENKIYEFENTVSPNVEGSGLHYKK